MHVLGIITVGGIVRVGQLIYEVMHYVGTHMKAVVEYSQYIYNGHSKPNCLLNLKTYGSIRFKVRTCCIAPLKLVYH